MTRPDDPLQRIRTPSPLPSPTHPVLTDDVRGRDLAQPLIRFQDSDEPRTSHKGTAATLSVPEDRYKNSPLLHDSKPGTSEMPSPDFPSSSTNASHPPDSPSSPSDPFRQRRLSFKRRIGAEDGSDGRSPIRKKSWLNRASIAVGLGPRSDDARHPQSPAFMRRIHTVSVNGRDDHVHEADLSSWERKPRIPSIMPAGNAPSHSNPIPMVPFVVLCLVCFGEFSSAGVAGPFLLFQIESFHVGGEGDVGYWAGVVASVFFFAQFLTSLLWASAAQKHGRRAVLFVSLLGNAVSLVLFGMSTNLRFAISVRLAQGLFNGAVGVAKGAVRDLTDETNEGRAMAQLGFAWGMGGIVGPLIGGVFCNASDKFPWLVGDDEMIKKYPYLLPCLITASFTALGAFLTLFISRDGGPRTGAIHLPEKTDVERVTTQAASTMGSFGRSAGKHISGYFHSSGGGGDSHHRAPSQSNLGDSMVSLSRPSHSSVPGSNVMQRTFTQQVDYDTGGPPSPIDSDDEGTIITNRAGASGFEDARAPSFARPRLMSRTTARQRSILGGGSAYGYDTGHSVRNDFAGPSSYSATGNRRSLLSKRGGRRESVLSTNQYAPDFENVGDETQKLSLAQRFLLANDDAVFGLSDLWVAAAINGDEAYGLDDEDDDFGYNYEDNDDEQPTPDDSIDQSDMDSSDIRESTGSIAFGHDEPDEDSPLMPRHLPPLHFARMHRLGSIGASTSSRPHMARRLSSSSRIPSVYSNTGIENPALLSSSAWSSASRPDGATTGGYDPTLAGIPESTSIPGTLKGKSGLPSHDQTHGQYGGAHASQISAQTHAPGQTSLFLQLPLSFIAHYCLLSLHSSTFDQIFMSYLVTPFQSGGLGLTAAHYAEVIAAMAFCQIGFQFYL